MKVTAEIVTLSAERFSLDAGESRFPGCHLSDVIAYMEQKKYGDRDDAATQAAFSCGFLFERLMAREAIEVECAGNTSGIVRVGEILWCTRCELAFNTRRAWKSHFTQNSDCKSGHTIAATPDAAIVRACTLKEYKFTKGSMRSCGADELADGTPEHPKYEHIEVGRWGWVTALRGYAFLLDVLTAQHEVVFVNGDYGITTRDYVIRRYNYTFTRPELKRNWEMMIANAVDGGLLDAC
jgi:hypothetical protein